MHRPLDALPEGIELAGYVVGRVLGRGGIGITYLARQADTGRAAVIKEFLPRLIAERRDTDRTVHPLGEAEREIYSRGLDRFRLEAQTLGEIRHPNVVRTQQVFAANGTAYLATDYVEGASLSEILASGGTLTEGAVREILDPLLDGLAAVHAAGLLHLDINPNNIVVRKADGQPVLIDFGAARTELMFELMSRTLEAELNMDYSGPENYDGSAHKTAATDIYALGATLYRCVAGEIPARAIDHMRAVMAGEPDPLAPAARAARGPYSPELLAAIDACLRFSAGERPQSAAALKTLLAENPATNDGGAAIVRHVVLAGIAIGTFSLLREEGTVIALSIAIVTAIVVGAIWHSLQGGGDRR